MKQTSMFSMALSIALSTTLLLAVAQSALGQDVRYNFDKTISFSKYKTYKWVTLKGAEPMNDLTDKQIKAAVDSQLAMKGLVQVQDDNADLFIAYQASVGQEKEYTSYSSDWGYGPGWGGGWYGGGGSGFSSGQTSTIYVGQLVVDMYDSAAKDLVWRGTAIKTLDPKAKPDKQEKNLNKAVAKVFKNYPPIVKQK